MDVSEKAVLKFVQILARLTSIVKAMSVLPDLLQYLQCLAGDLSAANCCHPGPLSC